MPRATPSKKNTYQDYVSAMALLNSALKDGKLPSVLVVYGASDFLIGKTIQVLRDSWRHHGELQALEAADLDESKFALLGQQATLFDPASLFLIRRLDQAKNAVKWLKTAKIAANGTKHFCFVQQSATLTQGLKTEFSRLKALEIPCTEPWPNELAPLIAGMARKAGLTLQPGAVALLLEATGPDLVKIDNEISRLSLIFADLPPDSTQVGGIAAADIAPLIDMLREDVVFELDHLLVQRHYAKAHTLLTCLLQRGESALALLGILSRHCRLALRVHHAYQQKGRGLNPRDLAFELRLPFNVAKGYTQYVVKTNARAFVAGLGLCQETDQKLKSSGICNELLLGRIIETLAAA